MDFEQKEAKTAKGKCGHTRRTLFLPSPLLPLLSSVHICRIVW
jgi:hypothetical protein